MKTNPVFFIFFIALTVVNASCKKDAPVVPGSDSGIFPLEEILKSNDQALISLVDKVRGSVGRRGPASKTIWSRKNEHGLGLYVSANHAYGVSDWPSPKAQFIDVTTTNLGIFETSQIPPVNGAILLGNTLTADFPFFHVDISPNATNTTVLPAEDFYLGLIDNQRVEQGPFPRYPDKIQTTTPLQMYDPANRTKTNRTWNTAVAGENAISIGYPQDKVEYPNGAVAYGKVVSDADAREIVSTLKAAGDAEGAIAYDAEVEFFVRSQGIAGMSGGGVFNSEGQLLGIMVRASNTKKVPNIIRVVKIAYIRAKLISFYNSLSELEKNKVKAFINGEL